MRDAKTRGIVLYTQNYKESDQLVKIFTREFGKRMFFVRNARRSRVASAIQPLATSELIARVNDSGFSFLEDAGHVNPHVNLAEDIFLNAYAVYLTALADAALPDNQVDRGLYNFLEKSLGLIDAGFDPEVITNIFELQLMGHFGAQLDLSQCVFCHRSDLPMDFSFKYSAPLCPNHLTEDERRSHLNPNVLYFANLFTRVDLDTLEKISLKPELKKKIRHFVDELYDEYVGIHLKPKKFIEQMDKWSDLLKNN